MLAVLLVVEETSSVGSVRLVGEIRGGRVERVRESGEVSSGGVTDEEGGSLAEEDVVESEVPNGCEALPVGDEGGGGSDADTSRDVPPVI